MIQQVAEIIWLDEVGDKCDKISNVLPAYSSHLSLSPSSPVDPTNPFLHSEGVSTSSPGI